MTTDNQQSGRSRADRIAARFAPPTEAPTTEAPLSPVATPAPVKKDPAAKRPASTRQAEPRGRGDAKWEDMNSRFQVWLPTELQNRIRVVTKAQNVSISRAFTEALEEWIAAHASSAAKPGEGE